MELQSERYYRSSGAAPLGGLVWMLACGLGVAVVAAIASALVSLYNPIAIISFIGPILCGALVGGTVRYAAKAGMVRSTAAIWTIGLLLGLVALHLSWVAYLSWYFRDVPGVQQAVGPVIIEPRAMWELMRINAQTGVWSVKGFMPTGWQLYAVWAAEAVLVVAFAGAVAASGTVPFCESCECWTEKTVEKGLFERPADLRELKRALEDERYDVLDQLQPATDTSADVLEAIVYSCPRCTQSRFLSMNRTPMQTEKSGERSKSSTDRLFANLKIPRDLADRLAQRAAVQQPERPDADPLQPEEQPRPEDA